ncbi:hypothetical protein [Jeotgalibacillus campisalis]|nr:hypothetical protein [Jeotgalibacillus campisalis]
MQRESISTGLSKIRWLFVQLLHSSIEIGTAIEETVVRAKQDRFLFSV